MLRKILLVTFSTIIASCASAPEKPVITLGVIDYPRMEVIEGETNSASIRSVSDIRYEKITSEMLIQTRRVPLVEYDKAISFKPAQWERLQNYVDSLVNYIENRCSQ